MSDIETPNTDESQEPAAADVENIEAVENIEDAVVSETEGADEQVVPGEDIESLKDELQGAKDEAVRAKAEMQNVRRRAEKDVENARRYSIEKIAKDIVNVVDNLERALESAGEEKSAFTEGVELTLKSFIDTLDRQGISQIAPEGEPFDPQMHEAISMVPNPDAEPNTVLNVVQKGYTLNGRVIRAAMVVVSQA